MIVRVKEILLVLVVKLGRTRALLHSICSACWSRVILSYSLWRCYIDVLRLVFFFISLVRQLHLPFKSRVVSIFNVVVRAPRQILCNLGPLVTELLVPPDDCSVFLKGPLVFLDIRIQVVVPPLSALFSNPARKSLRYKTPVFSSIHSNIFREF